VLRLIGRRAPPPPLHANVSLDGLRGTIDVDSARVSYLRAGTAGARRLILVHGTPGQARQWVDYLVEPPRHLEVIALDRPGFGISGPDAAVTSLEAQANAVCALLDPREKSTILLGHSLGGAVVAEVAAQQPDRIAAVIFLAAAVDPELERIHLLQHIAARAPIRVLLGRALRNANAELMALKSGLEQLAPRLPLIRAPALIVHGTADDRVPFANVAYLRRALTGASRVETIVLEHADHFLPWNAATVVRQAISRASALSW
jgi:pimeloyl-ACP methyl ester carboxylesterase